MAILKFENVSLRYPILDGRAKSLRNQIVRITTGGRIESESGSVNVVTALSDVSFDLKDGDSVGLIGHNGAGKTTLLRAMAGIYPPTSGAVKITGKVATVFDLGAGMDTDLSGYENIKRMGLLMGMSFYEIEQISSEIEDFTELGDFLSLPVRTYSSGMVMRLMFAVATSVQPEILLIDEMFGTGDSEFQRKAEKRMRQLISNSKIFVFASHSHDLIKEYCNRVFKLEHGKLTETKL